MSYSYKRKSTIGDWINIIILSIICLVCIVPLLYCVSVSLTDPEVYVPFKFYLIPKRFSLVSYQYLLSTRIFLRDVLNTTFVTVIGTILCLFTTFTMAYGLTKKSLPGRKYLMGIVIFTLVFSAGIVPEYMLMQKLGLLNSLWSLILGLATSAWNLLVVKSFMESLPLEMEESAHLDGCNDLQTFIKIIIPLSLPSIATFTLFFAVMHWNTYFQALMYLSDSKLWTLQLLIKSIVVDSGTQGAGVPPSGGDNAMLPQEPIRLASVVLCMLPILVVYPYLQKYFVKGVMIGAVKG